MKELENLDTFSKHHFVKNNWSWVMSNWNWMTTDRWLDFIHRFEISPKRPLEKLSAWLWSEFEALERIWTEISRGTSLRWAPWFVRCFKMFKCWNLSIFWNYINFFSLWHESLKIFKKLSKKFPTISRWTKKIPPRLTNLATRQMRVRRKILAPMDSNPTHFAILESKWPKTLHGKNGHKLGPPE